MNGLLWSEAPTFLTEVECRMITRRHGERQGWISHPKDVRVHGVEGSNFQGSVLCVFFLNCWCFGCSGTFQTPYTTSGVRTILARSPALILLSFWCFSLLPYASTP